MQVYMREAGCARNSHAGAPHIIEINLSANDWSTDRDKGGEGKLKACKSMHMNAKNGEKGWVGAVHIFIAGLVP
jgi:hypothetical protein